MYQVGRDEQTLKNSDNKCNMVNIVDEIWLYCCGDGETIWASIIKHDLRYATLTFQWVYR